jgi:hypothetical protein
MAETGDGGITVFVGGASGPSTVGLRLHVSWPLASLSVSPGEVRLSGRGPARDLLRQSTVAPTEVTVQAIHGPIIGGVALDLGPGGKWLFWTGKRWEVQRVLAEHGATVVLPDRRVRWNDTMGS